MARKGSRGSHDTAGLVLLIFGILFSLGGLASLAEGFAVSSAASSSGLSGGFLGNVATTYETTGALFLVLGIVLIVAGVWARRK